MTNEEICKKDYELSKACIKVYDNGEGSNSPAVIAHNKFYLEHKQIIDDNFKAMRPKIRAKLRKLFNGKRIKSELC